MPTYGEHFDHPPRLGLGDERRRASRFSGESDRFADSLTAPVRHDWEQALEFDAGRTDWFAESDWESAEPDLGFRGR
jgi:hypothetical protein